MAKLIVAFRNFANAPKKQIKLWHDRIIWQHKRSVMSTTIKLHR
jgi:hypothetical protein